MGIKFPPSDPGLLAWSLNFITKLQLDAPAYGVTVLAAAAYKTLHDNFAAKLAAVDPNIRNKVATIEKNDSRGILKTEARLLANIIDGQADVTDAMKTLLGLTVRKMPTPVPVPDVAPVTRVKSVNGRTVQVKLEQPEGEGRGRPSGVACAVVFSYIGPEPIPDDIMKWENQGTCSDTDFTIDFPLSVPGFSKVYLTAAWKNPRQQAGPLSPPIFTYLGSGVVTQAA